MGNCASQSGKAIDVTKDTGRILEDGGKIIGDVTTGNIGGAIEDGKKLVADGKQLEYDIKCANLK
jgi:hypothetical protein